MKRIVLALIILLCAVSLAQAEETAKPFSFGMQLEIDYRILTGSFSLWNLHYGLGFDFMVHLGANFYLGIELGAMFGFHKLDLTDPGFDTIDVKFPMHAMLNLFLGDFTLGVYGGAAYVGGAALHGGIVYFEDFSFLLLPDVGVKIGWGTVNHLCLKGGYIFGDSGYVYVGLGARLGLF